METKKINLICVNCTYGNKENWAVEIGLKNLVCPKCKNKFIWNGESYAEK